jgi:hypothetical protein
MKNKRFAFGAGSYHFILFLPRLSVYLEMDTLYFFVEVEFLRWYAFAGVSFRRIAK